MGVPGGELQHAARMHVVCIMVCTNVFSAWKSTRSADTIINLVKNVYRRQTSKQTLRSIDTQRPTGWCKVCFVANLGGGGGGMGVGSARFRSGISARMDGIRPAA